MIKPPVLAAPPPVALDQNDPAHWGLLDALGALGSRSDTNPQVEELDRKFNELDRSFMDFWKREEQFRRDYPQVPFRPPPGKKLDIGAEQTRMYPFDFGE